ncbi:hypothetical protein [Mycolicibacterium sp. HK-90]|uniref:hypothetical protein n=1 Tax=Mycolicibacterium sp. HK-90 TaxID=3056937 RepID=UPI0026590D79|nr:hypothetical protein [Mycolicibacterium sp. HK-90]WKG04720.1 hypothetical protein QU592_06355 [Mycolicibacterium sp. HK-90]
MYPQPGQTTRFEQLPGGVIRAHGVAHSRMIGQLARAEYLSKRWIWAVLVPAFVVAPVIISLFMVDSLSGGDFLLLLVINTVFGAGTLVFFGLALLYLTAPRSWSFKLPIGTPMYADFAPDSVGIGWLDRFNAIYLNQITQVRHVSSVLVIRDAAGTELLIPDELVPPHVASGLLANFGQRRQPAPAAMNVAQPQPVAPSLPQGPGPDGVFRTAAVADAGLADRLATAVRRSTAMRTALTLAIVMPLITLGYFALRDGELRAESVLPAGGVLVAGVGVIVYFMLIGIPMRFRQLVPAGAPISAEFGPHRIGIRLGGHLQTLDLDSVKRIRHADGAFHVTARGFTQGLIIPEQLVPPQVASGLFARFGAA